MSTTERRTSNAISVSRAGTEIQINLLNQQLFSLKRNGVEVMWNGGAPEEQKARFGWPNSEIIMFPIIGSAVQNMVMIGGEPYPMAKHGIARDQMWSCFDADLEKIMMRQDYQMMRAVYGGTEDHKRHSVFPASYMLTRTYSITDDGTLVFTIGVKNKSGRPMPFSIGWHPAFVDGGDAFAAAENNSGPLIIADLRSIERMDGNVIPVKDANQVYYETSQFSLNLEHNFGWGTLLWNRGEGFVAIEPLSAAPLSSAKAGEPMDLLLRKDFVKLEPDQLRSFSARIRIGEPRK